MFHQISLLVALLSGREILGFDLTILHTNDVHARFESTNGLGGPCSSEDEASNNCFGGAARRLTAVKQLRRNTSNLLLLDGGDQFQGTIWYTVLKYQPIAEVMNTIGYDAMAFGNHEFDDGLEGLAPFIQKLRFPVVNSNINARGSVISGAFQDALVKSFNFDRVGIVGYTTTETSSLSNTGDTITFNDEIESLKSAVAKLQQQGINKIIALGHAGITVDKEICQKIPGVDIVVGGHTNTFLYSGSAPSTPQPSGEYPLVFRDTGNPCLVVQDYAFGKYLGFLQLKFDENGVLESWEGNPILLDNRYPEDPQMSQILAPYASQLETYKKTIVGRTATKLDGDRLSCRLKECNMGNVMADSSILAYISKPWDNPKKYWSPVAIAIVNGGAVRDFVSEPWANLTLENIFTVMPFGNTVEKIKLKGLHLRQALEHSVEDYSTEDSHGKFLQFAGLKVVYDLSKPNGNRVVSVQARCADCPIPEYHPLEAEKVYDVVTISYLNSGGDGYTMIRDNIIESDESELLDIDAVRNYLNKNNPVTQGLEGRIAFVTSPQYSAYCSSSASSLLSTALSLSLVLCWIF